MTNKRPKERCDNISKACMGRIPWNKGLTKEDPRVLKNISGGSRKTQFKSGPKPEYYGEKNPNWKGGIIDHKSNYNAVRKNNHPNAWNGYVLEHRIIMEEHLDRILDPSEIVHHINGNGKDNRIENLQLMSQSEHMKLHRLKKYEED